MRIYGPLGTFFLREPNDRPIIMIAGGTGFAPVKALLEQLAKLTNQPVVEFYWGTRNLEDVYMKLWLELFDQDHDWFSSTIVLSNTDETYHGRKGFVHEAVMEDHEDFSDYDVYASGPPAMITAIRENFFDQGLDEQRFYFDSFDYSSDVLAKRNQEKTRNQMNCDC